MHTVLQTVVGAGLGLAFGQIIFKNEDRVLAYLFSQSTEAARVPLVTRLGVIIAGAVVLYLREIKKMSQRSKHSES